MEKHYSQIALKEPRASLLYLDVRLPCPRVTRKYLNESLRASGFATSGWEHYILWTCPMSYCANSCRILNSHGNKWVLSTAKNSQPLWEVKLGQCQEQKVGGSALEGREKENPASSSTQARAPIGLESVCAIPRKESYSPNTSCIEILPRFPKKGLDQRGPSLCPHGEWVSALILTGCSHLCPHPWPALS